jgi:hypothetical protein
MSQIPPLGCAAEHTLAGAVLASTLAVVFPGQADKEEGFGRFLMEMDEAFLLPRLVRYEGFGTRAT